jgi:hypothetical protein
VKLLSGTPLLGSLVNYGRKKFYKIGPNLLSRIVQFLLLRPESARVEFLSGAPLKGGLVTYDCKRFYNVGPTLLSIKL